MKTYILILAFVTGCGVETVEPAPRHAPVESDAGTRQPVVLVDSSVLDECDTRAQSIPGWVEAVEARRGALISGSGTRRDGTCQAYLHGALVLTVDCVDSICEVQ